MAKFQDDIKSMGSSYTRPMAGCYAIDNGIVVWEKCRENFASKFDDRKSLYFSHDNNHGDDVAAFIERTEDILEIDHSKFWRTNRDYATWIEPSLFWQQCRVRRSLYTILLRCGLAYIEKLENYDEALFSQNYIMRTSDAVKRFLFGFVEYQGPDAPRGWVKLFSNVHRNLVRQWLVMPEDQKLEPCFIAADALWA